MGNVRLSICVSMTERNSISYMHWNGSQLVLSKILNLEKCAVQLLFFQSKKQMNKQNADVSKISNYN